MTFFGVARTDDRVDTPVEFTPDGIPVYERPLSFGFTLVVEGKPGPSRKPVGTSSFDWDPSDPTVRPDLEIIVSRPLGDGSLAVCDVTEPEQGGVPASASFAETQVISNAINDLSCRFVDGSGNPQARGPSEACTLFGDGEYHFVKQSTVQYCARIAQFFAFPVGDTLVTARLRDTAQDPSEPMRLIIRVVQ